MANIKLHIPSFNAGEISPLLNSRFGVEKVQSGCRRLRNFLIHVHGPAFRRPGMEYMGASAGNGSPSSLRAFNFSTTTGFVLEFHPLGLRVWSNGLLVPLRNDVPLPYTETECPEVQMVQVNDVCYLAHPNHAPRKLVRYADDDWRLSEIEWDWPSLGDENVRSEEIAAPTVTELIEVPTYNWEEFTVTTQFITFSIVSGDTSSAQKQAWLERWKADENRWVRRHKFEWTTVVPSDFTEVLENVPAIMRMRFDGPATASSALRLTWAAGMSQLDTDVELPLIDEYVSVPAGEWQATVTCTGQIASGAQLWVQKRKANLTWENLMRVPLSANDINIKRGPTLTAATTLRFKWSTTYDRAMNGGTAKIETLEFPESADITVEVDAINGTNRLMEASAPIFQAGHIGSYWQIVHRRDSSSRHIVADEPTITAETSNTLRVSGQWNVFTYGTWDATLYLERRVGSVWEVVRSWDSKKDRNVVAEGEEPEEVEMRLRISDGTSEAATGAAVPRFVLEASDARVYGLVKITAVGELDEAGKTDTATVDVINTLHSTDPTTLWTEGAWSDVRGFPRTVALHGQRLWFAGTSSEPLRLWGSIIADFENFRRTSLDDGGVSFTAAAQQSNALQWMASHGDSLVFGTTGDEWTMTGGTERGPITPTSVDMQRRSGYGSEYQPALLFGEVVVFVQRGGAKLRQVAPRSDGTVWQAADMTVLAEHVARQGVTQISAQTFPYSILWAVTADGKLLSMTFEQEQNVFGWAVHETDGLVESVAVIYGDESDEVWLCVNRDGNRGIERLDMKVFARRFDEPSNLMYVDAGIRYESATLTSIVTGLEHLEGKTVSVLGDGAEMTPARVLEGQITLEHEILEAIVGLPFVSELQPMRVEIPLRDGTSQHRPFKASRVGLYLHDSLGGEVADAPDERFEQIQMRTVATAMDGAPALFTGEVATAIEARTRSNSDVIIRQTAPLPLNVGSITLFTDVTDKG